jgi:hypothetical protein
MCEPARDEKHPSVIRGELEGVPFQVGLRFAADIHGDVVDGSARAAHQLGFFVRRCLEMQASERAGRLVEGDVALSDSRVEPERLEFVHAEAAREEAAPIIESFELHGIKPRTRRLDESQSSTLTSGIGTTNLPPQVAMPDICAAISSRRFQGRMST